MAITGALALSSTEAPLRAPAQMTNVFKAVEKHFLHLPPLTATTASMGFYHSVRNNKESRQAVCQSDYMSVRLYVWLYII